MIADASFRKPRVGVVLLMGALLIGRAIALDQRSEYVQRSFTVEDGLTSNVLNAILQTRDGFLWVGTKDGLSRFDGKHFTTIEILPEGAPIIVSALAEGPDGSLWVGTSNGLARIPSGGDTVSAVYHAGSGEGDSIECLHFSRGGELFAGTLTGLYRFESGKFVTLIPKLWTSRIEEASNGHLLVITSEGFVEWDGARIIRHPELPAQLGVKAHEIFQALEDHTGAMWYCTTLGVAKQVGGKVEKLEPYGKDVVFRIYEDAQGAVWFSQSGGLHRVTAAGEESIAPHLHARFLAFDRDGDVWVGTKGRGLFRLKRQAIKMFTLAEGVPLGISMAVLAASDGKIWAGSNCGGISWFDGQRFHSYAEKDGLANSCVFSLAEDFNHDILIGTYGGDVFRFHEGHFFQIAKGNRLKASVTLALIPERDGSLWAAFSDGLMHLPKDSSAPQMFTTADGLSSDTILSAYKDRQGEIWVGTSGGIDRFENGRFVRVSTIRNIYPGDAQFGYSFGFGEDRAGQLFAFGGTGMFHVERNRAVKLDGAPKITGMVSANDSPEESDQWFCGDGIYRAAADSLQRWERERDIPEDYTRFGRADGMSSAQCSGGFRNMAIRDGKLWVATEQGVAMMEISRLRRTNRKPAVFMEKIVVGKTAELPGRALTLPAGTNHIELHFDSVELSSPEAIRLQYKLDGVDREWLDADATATAIYSGLPAGTHEFHVRACNSDGVWDQAGIVYNITQRAYFYETDYFRFAVLAALALVLWAAYRSRLRRVTEEMNARLEERVRERTRLARDIHDTLLQTIQASKMIATNAIDDMEDPRARALLEKLSNWLGKAMQEARASLRSLRASATEINDLGEALRAAGEELAATHPLGFHLEVEGTGKTIHPIVREEVYRIGYEAIRNAFLHSGGNKVEVKLSYAQGLGVVVHDDGQGIDRNIAAKGKRGHFGLTGMQERASRIGGKLTIRGFPGTGTEVELSIPGNIAFCEELSKPPGAGI